VIPPELAPILAGTPGGGAGTVAMFSGTASGVHSQWKPDPGVLPPANVPSALRAEYGRRGALQIRGHGF